MKASRKLCVDAVLVQRSDSTIIHNRLALWGEKRKIEVITRTEDHRCGPTTLPISEDYSIFFKGNNLFLLVDVLREWSCHRVLPVTEEDLPSVCRYIKTDVQARRPGTQYNHPLVLEG